MKDNPYDSPAFNINEAAYTSGGSEATVEAFRPLADASFWLRLLGIVNIIGGVLYCLTIIGIVVGWLPIWMGILFNDAGSSFKRGYEQRSLGELSNGARRLSTAVTIMGVLCLIGIIASVGYLVIVIGFFVFAISGMN